MSDIAALQEIIRQLQAANQQLQREKEQLRRQLEQLLRRLYGPRGEKLDPAQLLLFAGEVLKVEDTATEAIEPASAETRKPGHGRKKLARQLPRERLEHPVRPEDIPCPDCGKDRTRIGEEISEQLEYRPAVLFVIEHVRPKLACQACREHVITAEKPPQPIEKGLPGPSLVAHIITSKYLEHMPLYRLEGQFERLGGDISRSTMCGWIAAAADRLRPLYQRIITRILQSKVLQTDETRVPVLDPTLGKTRSGRLWAYLGDVLHPLIAYEYSPDRSAEWPRQFLAGYRGYLQADAYGGYDGLFADGRIIEVGCWAHARRYFYDARDSDPARSHVALAYIRRLYKAEEESKGLDPPTRHKLRQEHSAPILRELRAWIDREQPAVLPKSPLGQAMTYALNQWTALCRYCDDGDLSIDNNASERALRAVAIGRKNWLFAGSDAGGHRAAVLYTLIGSCKRHGLDPFPYLRDVLLAVSTTPASRIDELLPDRWAAARAQ